MSLSLLRLSLLRLSLLLTRDGREYLFASADEPRWSSNWWLLDWLVRLRCRLRGHPSGPMFYNSGGLEPDPRCKNCGDHIG